ncbi:Exosome complex exonuclease RRP44 [Portunus trituberculatus]|uniref:Exosome complex exonuclease RRP44 n=1 Tax=Portunus trituberculatus TaxID=210409 RepID=A0A5B7D5C0_PORTR|nr:Exosome complex exonuclease RRP44 [Portunus trituberculatus]
MGLVERKLKVFYRKTKKGNIIKVVREHYLRNDVWCGYEGCRECECEKPILDMPDISDSTLVPEPHFIMIDTNVALHQIDVLCDDSITNVIVPQTVVGEVRHRSLPIYKRLRDLIETSSKKFYVFTNEHHNECYVEREAEESANDRNDRAIRVACWWYKQHLRLCNQKIILLTNDYANRDKVRVMELEAYTTKEYVSSLKNRPGLLDIVASGEEDKGEDTITQRCLYAPHWSMDKIRQSLKTGKLRQGCLKTSRNNFLEANVLVEGLDKSVLIQGRLNINRALNDDTVAVELLPEDQWCRPANVIIDQEKQEEENKDKEEADEDAIKKEDDLLAAGQGEGELQPTGRVVGIIRRKWRQYCGIIKKNEITESIIKSRGELSYEQAQQRIDDPNMQDDLTNSLRNLNMLAKQLKKKRIDAGALVLASMEVKFHVDPDTDTVVDIVAKQHLETMSMVEEFMLLANVTSAECTLKHFPDCALLRRHPAPPHSNFESLLVAAKSQNIELDVSSNKTLAESLNNVTRDNNPFFNSMLRIMTTRCMMQALYFCSGTLEPTEYADIIVHRLLAVIIEADRTYPDLLNPKKLADLSQHINYRHKMAQYAGRGSAVITAIQLTLYLDKREKKKEKKNPTKGAEPMEVDKIHAPEFEFNEKELFVKCGSVIIRPFDHLKIQVTVDTSDVQHQRVVSKLIEPIIPGFSVPSLKRESSEPKETTSKKRKK